ncbi:MAG: hypothetical protein DDG59_09305 [Anaerolineae bacterium]|jgi:hypothetical protein|nr:MAG: hypothetical protein DDG59_09305 [Anaerolineae bacterium]
MKTIFRLTVIVFVMLLIGIGLYAAFQNPTIQSQLGLTSAFGWRGRAAEGTGELFLRESGEQAWRGTGNGRGFGGGQGGAFGRRAGRGEGHGELGNLPSSSGWLGLLGVLLRLAILMAIVVALVKFGRWIGRKFKPSERMNAQNVAN